MTVLVIGDVINDVVVVAEEAVTRGSDTPSRVASQPGGQGANQAAWLASLGTTVRFVGRAGAGDVDHHRRLLALAGVEAHISADAAHETGTIVVLVEGGERSMFTDRGAGPYLDVEDLPAELLDGVDLLHVSAYSLFSDPSRRAVLGVMAEARRRSIEISVDPASVSGLRRAGALDFLRWVEGSSVLFPNMDEGRLLAGESDAWAIVDGLLGHFSEVALKLGPGGAVCARSDGERVTVPVVDGPVVDTTGAGDAFAAGYLAERLSGGRLAECARAGARASAMAVGHLGGRPIS